MPKFNIVKKNLLIILIVLVGLIFRFRGISPGYPRHTDEAAYSSAYTMIQNKNLDPGRYDYPSGLPLMHYFIYKTFFIPLGWTKYYLENLGPILDGFIKLPLNTEDTARIFKLDILGDREMNIMYWGRYVTAAFGVGVIIITYFLAKKVFDKRVGLISAFLLAVNFRQVLNSHIGLPDIYNAFFLCLTVYFIYRIIENPTRWNYFWVGLFNGIFFSIKFQTYAFIPLFVAYLFSSWRNWKSFLISMLVTFLFIVLLNPHLLIKFEIFRDTQIYVASKYGVGANVLNIYPISYLYHIGIGKIIFVLAVIGLALSIMKYSKKSLVINLVLFQSLLTFFYLTRGGFYTRNFVAITPLILILAGLAIREIFSKWDKGILTALFVLVISFGNIKNSYVVIKEYTKPWNENLISEWIGANLPKRTIVSAHPNTPLAIEGVTRLVYEPDEAFSIDEFKLMGAKFAVSNSSWTTNSFYWWMGESIWEKPVNVLEYTYPALALRELEQFGLYAVNNSWQAPDTDFLVAKIPKIKISSKKEIFSFDFSDGAQGWEKSGKFWTDRDNLEWKDGALVVRWEPASIPSLRWESQPIEIISWNGFEIDYNTETKTSNQNLRSGYVFVSFYNSLFNAQNSKDRTGLRLSDRNIGSGNWIGKKLIGEIPNAAKYMTIGFYNYAPSLSETTLDSLKVYKAEVNYDFEGFTVEHIKVNQNNIFPNSHGNL